jgi:hypothetical protein
LFSREGGSPGWAPAFAGEQAYYASQPLTAPTPHETIVHDPFSRRVA